MRIMASLQFLPGSTGGGFAVYSSSSRIQLVFDSVWVYDESLCRISMVWPIGVVDPQVKTAPQAHDLHRWRPVT